MNQGWHKVIKSGGAKMSVKRFFFHSFTYNKLTSKNMHTNQEVQMYVFTLNCSV